MESHPFDRLTRRFTLGGGFAALAAASWALVSTQATAGAKKKRKKRKKKKPKPPSCAELCGFDCIRCFYRADAPPLCGDSGGTDCVSCRSDNDCVGDDHPYCVTHIELRSTGSVSTLCAPDGSCACAPGALGACSSATACTP